MRADLKDNLEKESRVASGLPHADAHEIKREASVAVSQVQSQR